MDKTGSRS